MKKRKRLEVGQLQILAIIEEKKVVEILSKVMFKHLYLEGPLLMHRNKVLSKLPSKRFR